MRVSRPAVLASVFIVGLVAEELWPLRQPTKNKLHRIRRNLSVAALSAVVLSLGPQHLVRKTADLTQQKKWGLLPRLPLGPKSKFIFALLCLDYSLYLWHMMTHRVPFLWRFHRAHHADADLDISTASRFHFGELTAATVFRMAQIAVLGVDLLTLKIFETGITVFAQFHHSNLRLPEKWDHVLGHFIMTPRMHGLHHSVKAEETDSNYGTILTVWDRLHGTKCTPIKQAKFIIGAPDYPAHKESSLSETLWMPFKAKALPASN